MKDDLAAPPQHASDMTADGSPAAPPSRLRRTQQERTDTTKQALLNAAVATLVEEGFAGTSAAVVCNRAGLSHGALFRHFATKSAFLVATAEYCYSEQLTRFRAELSASGAARPLGDGQPRPASKPQKSHKAEKTGDGSLETERVEMLVSALWKLALRPEMTAVNELRLGARTDATLRKGLSKAGRTWEGGIGEVCNGLFPELVALPGWSATLALLFELLQALGITRLLEPERSDDNRALKLIADLARASLKKGKHYGRS